MLRQATTMAALAAVGLLGSSAAGSARSQAAISPAFVTKANKVCAKIDADFTHVLGPFPYPNFNPRSRIGRR